MEKKSNSLFKLIAVLMLLLHVLRGNELSFTIDGILPFILYYGTILLFIFCFAWDAYGHIKALYIKLKMKRRDS